MVQMLVPDEGAVQELVGWHTDAALLEQRVSLNVLSQERETEVVRLRFSGTQADPQVHMKGHLAAYPSFVTPPPFGGFVPGYEGNLYPLGFIKNIRSYVANLIDEFEPFFKQC
jgi:hypothetical protein